MFRFRAFFLTFATALLLSLLHGLLLGHSGLATTVFLGGYLLLAAFGFAARRDGLRYRHVFALTWAFPCLWLLTGLLTFIFSRGSVPTGWSAELYRQMLTGYALASVMFVPAAFLSSGLGFALSGLAAKSGRKPAAA